jgi:predicted DNA-binding ribbon-helix-helix protein
VPNPRGAAGAQPGAWSRAPACRYQLSAADSFGVAAASMEQRGANGGVRTTLDLPRPVHRTLKRLAADEDTSLQALVMAAILQTHPDLA